MASYSEMASSIVLDQVLYELLMEEELRSFTVLQLREAYALRVELNGLSLPRLRVYIYDQVRRLERVGWVKMDEEKTKRHQLYHVVGQPDQISVRAQLPALGMQMKSAEDDQAESSKLYQACGEQQKTDEVRNDSSSKLEEKLKEAKLDFLTTLGESESYKQIMEDMPELHDQLVQDFDRAREKSLKLLGRVRAYETALERLEGMS
jgi:hypothetical protein